MRNKAIHIEAKYCIDTKQKCHCFFFHQLKKNIDSSINYEI